MTRGVDLMGYAGLGSLVLAGLVRLIVPGSGAAALALAVLGVVLFLVYFFRAGADVQRFLGRRSTREGGGVFALAFLVVGILVLINVLAAEVRLTADVTQDRLFTLSPETRTALEQAPSPPKAWLFYPEGDPTSARLRPLMEAAEMAVPRFSFEVVDPDREPVLASGFGLTEYAGVVEIGERHQLFLGGDEQNFVTAVVRASRPERPRVAFLRGHGEYWPRDKSRVGLFTAGSALQDRGYAVLGREFAQGRGLADSVDVLVIPGPRVSFSASEEDSVLRFLDSGGRLLLLLDPANRVVFERLLGRLGLRFVPEILVDPDLREPQMVIPVEYSGHPVVRSLRNQRIPVVLPGVGEVAVDERNEQVRTATIMRSGSRTRSAADSTEAPRSRSLAVAMEWRPTEDRLSRMVVIGDADFPVEQHVTRGGNGNLFLNAVQWLAEEEVRIAVTPRSQTDRPVVITRHQGRALMVVVALILPLAILVGGTVTWWRRR